MERVILVSTIATLSLTTVLDGSRNPAVMLVFSAVFTCLLAIRVVLPGAFFRVGDAQRRLTLLVLLPLIPWLLLTWMQAGQLGIGSMDPYRSHIALLGGLGYTVAWLLFMSVFDSDYRLRLVAGVITLTALAQAVFGLLNYYGDDPVLGWMPTHYAAHRVTGTYVNRNYFANLLVMASGFALVWLLTRRRDTGGDPGNGPTAHHAPTSPALWRLVAMAVLVLLAGGVVLSGSRGALMSAMVAGVLLLIALVTMRGVRVAWRPLGFLFAAVAMVFGFGLMQLRLSRLGSDSPGRLEQWRSTLDMVLLRPWTGHGAGAYETAFRNRLTGDLGPLTYNHAHNDYLQMLMEQGVLGLLLIAFAIGIPLAIGVRRAFGRRSIRRRRWILAGLFGVTAMLTHALVDGPLQVPANAWVFIALLAVLGSAATRDYRRDAGVAPAGDARVG